MKNAVHSNRLAPSKNDSSRFYDTAPRQSATRSQMQQYLQYQILLNNGNSWYEIGKLSKKKKIGSQT